MQELQKPNHGYKFVNFKPRYVKIEIPIDWYFSTIGEICRTSSGGTPLRSNTEFYNGDIPWIKTGELNDGYLDKTEEYISSDALISSSAKKFPPNTVLFAMYGATIGKTCITTIEFTTNQACCAFLPIQKNVIDPYFLQQYLILKRKLIISLREGAGQPNTSQDFMRTFQIAYPHYKEQIKISSILSKVDELIQKTDKIIEQTQRLKKGLMQKLLTKGIGHTKFKKVKWHYDKEIEIPKAWKVVLLDEIAQRGTGHTPDAKKPEYYNGGIKWVSLADSNRLDNLYISETTKEISEKGIENSSAVKHPVGTVIMSRDAGVGKSAILKTEMAVSQHFVTWRCKEYLNHHFLYYLLQYLKPLFESIAIGTTIKTIGLPFFKKLRITLPSLNEQERIASILLNVDLRINNGQEYNSKLENLKKGLMQKLLTGKIRVKV